MNRKRMTYAERHIDIIRSAAPLFADHPVDAVTTRAIAESAGVSEALLYRHFPSKEALYEEMLEYYFGASEPIRKRLEEVPTNTENLAFLIYTLIGFVFRNIGRDEDEARLTKRIMARSIMGDGVMAKRQICNYEMVQRKMQACYEWAVQAGDVDRPQSSNWIQLWFTHHLAIMLGLLQTSDAPVIEYGADDLTIHRETVRFCLRGLGVKESVIATYGDFMEFEACTEEIVNMKKEHLLLVEQRSAQVEDEHDE